jgi:hypothetical protein
MKKSEIIHVTPIRNGDCIVIARWADGTVLLHAEYSGPAWDAVLFAKRILLKLEQSRAEQSRLEYAE